MRNLNLFELEAWISKWSKSIEQLDSSKGSDTTIFDIFKAFFSQNRNDYALCGCNKKVAVCFTIIMLKLLHLNPLTIAEKVFFSRVTSE